MCWIQPSHFHHVGDSLINQACLGCLNGLSEFPELIEGTTHRIKPWVKPHGFIKFPSTNSSIGSLLAQISLLVCVFFSVYINILQYISKKNILYIIKKQTSDILYTIINHVICKKYYITQKYISILCIVKNI